MKTHPDLLLDYVLTARPLHAELREAVIQLSAYALLQAMQPVRALIDASPLDRARATVVGTFEAISALRAPEAAAHHHHHLKCAAAALERALAAGYSIRHDAADALFISVEEAELHVRAAGRLLPGFEMVDLTQACCALHASGDGLDLSGHRLA